MRKYRSLVAASKKLKNKNDELINGVEDLKAQDTLPGIYVFTSKDAISTLKGKRKVNPFKF